MDFISTALLLAGLGCLLMVILFAVWGFFAKARRELTWTAVILVLLVLAWLIFGDAATLLNSKGAIVELLKPMVQADTSSCKTLWDVIVLFGQEMIPNGQSLLVEGKETYDLFYSIVAGVLRGVGLIAITLVVFLVTPVLRLISHIVWLIVRSVKKKKAAKAAEEATDEETPAEEAGEPTPSADETVVVSESDLGMDDVIVSVGANDAPKPFKYRSNIWGAIIGALKGVAVIIILFAPIAGICSVLAEASPATRDAIAEMIDGGSAKENVSDEEEGVADLLFGFVDSYYESGLGKFVEGSAYFFGDSFSSITFDSALTIETETQSIAVRKELMTFIYAVNGLNGKISGNDLGKWSQDEVERALEALKDSKLLVEIMPVLVEFLYEDEELLKLSLKEMLQNANQQGEFLELRYIDWDKDIETILDAVKEAYKLDLFNENFNVLTMNPEVLLAVVDQLGNTELINDLLPILVNTALRMEAVEKLTGKLDKNPDLSGINWKEDLIKIVGVYDTFQDLGITSFEGFNGEEFFRAVLKDDEMIETIVKMLTQVASLDMFDQLLIPVAFSAATGNESLHATLDKAGQVESFNKLKELDWEKDMNAYAKALKAAAKLFDPEAEKMIDVFALDTTTLKEVVNKLFEAESFELVLDIATYVVVNLEAVEKIIGNEQLNVSVDAINWHKDLLSVVDAYDEFKKMGFASVDDFKQDAIELVKGLLEDDAKFEATKELLNSILETSLFTTVGAPFAESALNAALVNAKFEELKGIINLSVLTNEQWIEDIDSILELARKANEMNVLSLKLAEIDLTSDDAIATIKDALSTVLGLNILGDDAVKNELVTALLDKFDLISKEPDFDEVVWDEEIVVLQDLVDSYAALAKLEGFDINNGKFDIAKLLNNDSFYDAVIDAVDTLVDSGVVLAILPDVIQVKVLPLVEEKLNDYGALAGLLDNVTSEELLNALSDIIEAVKDAQYIGAFAVAFKEAELETLKLYEVDRIKNIVDVLLGNVIFEGHEGQILRIILRVAKVLDVEKGYFNNVDFEVERAILLNVIESLRPILNDRNFNIFNGNELNIDEEYFLTQINTQTLINAVQQLVGEYAYEGTPYLTYSKLVEMLLPSLYNKYVVEGNLIPADYQGLVDILQIDGLTGEQLLGDIRRIVYIADQAVLLNAQEFLSNGELLLDNAILDNILDAVKDIHMFEGVGAEIIVWVFDKFVQPKLAEKDINVELTVEDLNGISLREDVDLFKAVLHGVSDFLIANKLTNINELKQFVDNKEYTKEPFVSVENGVALVNILTNLTKLQSIELVLEIVFPVMLEKLDDKFDVTFWKQQNFTGEVLAEDLRAVLDIVKLTVEETEILTYFVNGWEGDLNLTEEKVSALQTIIAKVFELNLIKGYEANLVDSILNKVLAKNEKLDASAFATETIEDWAAESAMLQEVIALLADALAENNILTIADIKTVIEKKLYLDYALIKNENIALVADLLAVLSQSKLVGNAVVAILPTLPTNVVTLDIEGQKYPISIESLQNLNAEDFQADLLTLSQIIDTLLAIDLVEIYDYKLNSDFDLTGNGLAVVADAVDMLYGLNVISKCIDSIYVDAINLVYALVDSKITNVDLPDFTLTLDDVKDLDFEAELGTIANAIRNLPELFKALELAKIEDVIAFINVEDKKFNSYDVWTEEAVYAVEAVARQLVNLQTIGVLLPAIADFVAPKIDATNLPLAFLRYYLEVEYTGEKLAEDLNLVLDMALEAYDLGALEYLFTQDIKELSLVPVENILGLAQQLNIVRDIEAELVEFALNYVFEIAKVDSKFNVTVAELQNIDFDQEIAMLQAMVAELDAALEASGLVSLADVMTFVQTKNFLDYSFYNSHREVAYNALDAVELFADSQLLALLAPQLVQYAKDVADNAGYNIDFLELSSEELAEDIKAIVAIAEDAIELNVLDFLKYAKLEFIDTDIVAEIVRKVSVLNIINGQEDDWAALAFNTLAKALKFSVRVTADEFDIDWVAEKAALVAIVKAAGQFLTDNDLNHYPKVVEFFKGNGHMDVDFWTANEKANAYAAAEIVEQVLQLQVVEFALPLALAKAFAKLDSMGYPVVFMEEYFEYEYTSEKLVEDASVLVDILVDAIEVGALEYVLTKEISNLDLAPAASIITNLYELHFVNDNIAELVAYAGNVAAILLGEEQNYSYDETDFADVDFEQDFALLAEAVSTLAVIVDDFSLTSLESVMNFFKEGTFKDVNIYNEECVDNLLAIAHNIVDVEFIQFFLPLGVELGAQLAAKAGLDIDFVTNLTQEELVEDLNTVLAIAQKALDIAGYEYINTTALEAIDFAGINEIIAMVDEINALHNYAGEWAAIIVTLANEKLADKLHVAFEVKALEGIDWSAENAALQTIVTKVGEFLNHTNNGLETVDLITSFISDKSYAKTKFWTRNNFTNVRLVADIIDTVLDMQIADAGLAYGIQVAIKLAETKGLDLAFLSPLSDKGATSEIYDGSYSAELLQQDLDTIIVILDILVEFGLKEILENEVVDDFDFYYVAQAIEELQNINLLTLVEHDLVALAINKVAEAMKLDLTVTANDIAYIDFDEENAQLQALVMAISEALFEANLNGYDEIASFIHNKSYADVNFYNAATLVEVLEAVRELVKLETVQLALNPLLNKAVEVAQKQGLDLSFLENVLSNAELVADVNTLTYALEELVADDLLETVQALISKDPEWDLAIAELENVNAALDHLATVKLLAEDRFAQLILAVFEKLGVSTYVDLSDVTFAEEIANVQAILSEVEAFALTWDMETVKDIKEINFKGAEIYFYHQEEQLLHVHEIIEIAKNDKLLSEILFPLLDKYMPTFALNETSINALVDLPEIYKNYDEFAEDLTRIQNILETIISLELETVYDNKVEIPWNDVDAVKAILNNLLGANYFNAAGRGYEIAQVVCAMLGVTGIDGSAFDLAADAVKLGEIYEFIANILNDDAFPYHTVYDFKHASFNMALLTKESTIENLKAAAKKYMETTIFDQTGFLVLLAALPVFKAALPEYYELLLGGVSNEQFAEDFNDLFEAALAIRDTGLQNIANTELAVVEENLIKALDLIMNTEIFNGKFYSLANLLLKDFVNGKDYGKFNFEDVEFVANGLDFDLDVLVDEILPAIFDVCEALGVNTLAELKDVANLNSLLQFLAVQENFDLVEEIVEDLASLTVLRNNISNLYDHVIYPLVSDKTGFIWEVADLYFYPNQDAFLADIDAGVKVVKELNALGASAAIADHLNGTSNYTIDYTRSEITTILSTIVNTKFFEEKQAMIAEKLLGSKLAINYEEIDFVADYNNYYEPAYEKLAVVLNELGYDTVPAVKAVLKSLSSFNWKPLVSDYVLGTQTIEAFAALSGSEFLYEASGVILEKVSQLSMPLVKFADPQGLSKDQLQADYDNLLVAAQAALDFIYNEGQHVRTGKNISIENVEKALLALETAWNLNILAGKHAEIAFELSEKLELHIGLSEFNSVNWLGELEAVSAMLENALVIANNYGLHDARSAKNYLTGLKALGKKELIKEAYRLFMRDNYEHTVEFVEALGASELLPVALLPVYEKLTASVAGELLILLDLSTYSNAMLEQDLDLLASAARNMFDSNIYQSYCAGTQLDSSVEPYIAAILMDLFALNILDVKAEDIVLLVEVSTGLDLSNLDLGSVNWDYDGYVYANHAADFVVLFNEVALNVRGTLGTLDVLGNEAVVTSTLNLYNAFVNTYLGEAVAYYLVTEFVGPMVAKVDADSPLANADHAKAVEFLSDLSLVAEAFINMGFFGNGANATIDLAAADGLTLLSSVLKNNTNLPAKLYEYLDKTIARVYAVGTFELDYSGISTKQEAKYLISIAKSALQLAKNYAGRIASRDFAVVTDGAFQNDFTTFVNKVADDAVLGQLLLPLSRGAARMLATAVGGFELFEGQTPEEFNANLVNVYLPEVYELLGYAEELGVFNKTLKYKDTETLIDIVDFLVTAELSKDNLTPVLRYLLAKLNVLTPELEAKLEAINWLDEASLGNAFLAKFKYALNVPGVQITKLATLKNNEFITLAAEALEELETSYLLEILGRTLAIRLYDKVLGGRLQFVKQLLTDANYTDADFVEDYATVLEMVEAFVAFDYFGAGSLMGKVDNKLASSEYAVKALAQKAITLNIIDGHEQELVEKAFSKVSFLNGVTVDYSLIADWGVELAILANATEQIAAFVETYENEIGKTVKVDELAFAELINPNVKAAFLDTVDQIAQSVIGQAAFKEVYNSMIKPMIEDAQPDFVEVLDLETLAPSEWANELDKLLTIYDAVDGVIAGGSINGTFAQLADIMAQLFGLAGYEGLVAVKANPKKYLDIIVDYLPAAMTQGLTIDTDSIYDQAQAGTAGYNAAYIAEAETYYELLLTLNTVFGGTVSGLDFGTIDTKTWQEIALVLVAVNNSKSLRGILVQVIGDTITNMGGTGDVNINDLVSADFWTQYNNKSYNEAFWAGAELVYIAQIVALSKELNMSSINLNTVELGTALADIDPLNPTAFDVNNAGFKQLLQLVALTNTLDITKLGGTGILYSFLVTSQGLFSASDVPSFGAMPAGAAAFDEIDNIINVLEQTKGLTGSMSTQMFTKTTAQIAELLEAIVASSVMKSVLPVLVNKTIEEESATATPNTVSINEFISSEYAAINWATATPAQWDKYWSDAQLELLAKLVKLSHQLGAETKLFEMKLGLSVNNAQNIAVADFDSYLTSAGLYSLLQLINYVELFDINALQGPTGIITIAVDSHSALENTKPLGTLPASATKAEWDAEIYAIVSSISMINDLVGTSGAIKMDDKLAELVHTDSDAVEAFLHLVNSSVILREMLPQMMYDSLETALAVVLTPLFGVNAGAQAATIMNTTSNATISWIRGQLAGTTASQAEWDAQITTICAILADPSTLTI